MDFAGTIATNSPGRYHKSQIIENIFGVTLLTKSAKLNSQGLLSCKLVLNFDYNLFPYFTNVR